MFLLKYIEGRNLKNEDRIFIEINLLMETFNVNVAELLLNLPVFNYAVKYPLTTPAFAGLVDQRHGF